MLSIPIRCHDFVGRASELEHLLGRRRDAGERRGGAVLVSGEAGIGKSRLIAEFVAASGRSTARLVRAECREFAQSPFGPLADILSALGERGAFLREAPSPEAQLEELLATFSRIFERRTTVVIVEDLHWASRELVQALRLLVARAQTQRALFVVSYRDNEILPGHANFIPLGRLLREPAVSTLALARFDLDQTVGLLERALGADVRVPRVVLTDVARRSDGNPLYGEELLRHAVDGLGRPERARANAVPVSLHAIVRERVERCSPRERAALEMAALFGRDFDRDELLATGGETAAPSAAELETLVQHQLLVFDELRGRYAFRHALTRDVMYAKFPNGSRSRSIGASQPLSKRAARRRRRRSWRSRTTTSWAETWLARPDRARRRERSPARNSPTTNASAGTNARSSRTAATERPRHGCASSSGRCSCTRTNSSGGSPNTKRSPRGRERTIPYSSFARVN